MECRSDLRRELALPESGDRTRRASTIDWIYADRGPNINDMLEDFYKSDPQRGCVGGYLVGLRNAQYGPVHFAHNWSSPERVFGANFHADMEEHLGHSVGLDAYGEPFPDPNHRVALDPDVKDTFGRTHDVENLFVADGSLFPTIAPSNPSLTIQALATRSATRRHAVLSAHLVSPRDDPWRVSG